MRTALRTPTDHSFAETNPPDQDPKPPDTDKGDRGGQPKPKASGRN